MFDAERFRDRMKAVGLSQNGLARRVGLSQQTISRLAAGERYGTRHLHRIARELGTTPAYLTGETDDPDENAPAPLPAPDFQIVPMQVALPAQPALASMFRALIRSLPADVQGDELADELAMLLPIGLSQLKVSMRTDLSGVGDERAEPREAGSIEKPARRRASRG